MNWHHGPERDAWVRVRRGLSLGQQCTIFLAQLRGRVLLEADLRDASAVRAAYLEAVQTGMWRSGSAFRWLRWALVVLSLVNAVFGALRASGGEWGGWVLLGVWAAQAVLWWRYPSVMASTVQRAWRSAGAPAHG